jgi:hypothetical protein
MMQSERKKPKRPIPRTCPMCKGDKWEDETIYRGETWTVNICRKCGWQTEARRFTGK